MAEGAALLVDEVLPREPLRQWLLSVPFALRYLFATAPAVRGQVLGIVYLAIANHLIKSADMTCATAQTGAVTLIQRFASALDLNIHFPMLFPDGVYVTTGERLTFRRVPPPTVVALEALVRVISKRGSLGHLNVRICWCEIWKIAGWRWIRLTAQASMIYWGTR